MDSYAYLSLAKELAEPEEGLSHEQKEARWRSAVSRAYYAVFLHARDVFDPEHRSRPAKKIKGSYHKWLWNKLKTDPHNRERRDIGDQGDDLRRLRIDADYGEFIDDLPLFVAGAMEDADELREALEDFPPHLA